MPRLATATRDSYRYRDQIDRNANFYVDGVRAVPSDGVGAPPYGNEGDPPRDYLLFGANNPGMEISAVRDVPFQVELWFRPDPECFGLTEDRHLVWSWGAISSTAQTNHRAVGLVVMRNSGGSTIAQVGRYDGTAGGNWSNSNFNVTITPGGWHYFKAIFTSTTAVRYWLYDYTAATWRLNDSGTTYNAGTHEGINIGNVVGTWGNEMLFSNGDSKPFVGGISCFRVALTSNDGVNPATTGIPTYTPVNVGTDALLGFIAPGGPDTPVGTDFTTRLNSVQSTGWTFSTATFDLFFDNSDFLVTTGQTIYISETQSVWMDEQNQTANKGAFQGLRTVTGHSAGGIQFVSDNVDAIWAGGIYDFIPFLRNGTGIGFVSVL